MPVTQVKGACSGTDISNYIAACDSQSSTQATCDAWFNGDASTSCQSCLVGPVTGSDPGTPTGQGGIWLDYQGHNIGANVPGCLDKQGMSACASAYQNVIECLVAAGCFTDPSSTTMCMQSDVTNCQNTELKGGACAMYLAPAQSACGADFADGGLLNGGPCSTDDQVLSVICGNGSGDGG